MRRADLSIRAARISLRTGLTELEQLTAEVILLLMGVAVCAAFIDAIAGGGGLLALPALLWAGLPPVQALATNKAQAVFGTATASFRYVREGQIDLRRLRLPIAATFVGAATGAVLVQQLDSTFLERLIPVLLMGFALYFLFSPKMGNEDRQHRISHPAFGLLIGTSVGFYDGFFGPGTGTFFTAAFVLLLGYNLRRATAGTKVLNFTSNLAAFLVFAVSGETVWVLGLCMGVGQIIGAWLGAHVVLRHGAVVIRPLLVVVSLALSAKLLLYP